MSRIAETRKQSMPHVVVTGDWNKPGQAFLVVDCVIIGVQCIPMFILAAYFVYNICYARGCHNLFEVSFLDANPTKLPSSIKHFMTTVMSQ